MVFYFTATGNSLYAAKQFDTELVSIPQELKKTERHYKADSIGIVCPLYELDKPEVIKSRLAVYHEQTEPLKGFYAEKGVLKTVIGQEQIDDTTALTIAAIESIRG